ncbi:MAG TPA: gliding motility lipoprotein GldD [Salinimicrobium sp.]|nr:gliding motility lipoprotein GldD [Salinimicrobium sp.]
MKKLGFLIILLCVSCKESPQPKPDAFLALNYPVPEYNRTNPPCPFNFEVNKIARIEDAKGKNPCWINVTYKKLNGTIFITYQPVENNLDSLLRDAQQLPLQHTIKADYIEGDVYTNKLNKTYGMFYEVSGDAASQAQFYLTDSTNHFLTGSIYFEALPDYDSILPAADYLMQDMRHLMESLRWEQAE